MVKTEKELQEIFERALPSGKLRLDTRLMREGSGFRSMLERHSASATKWLDDVRTVHTPRMYPVHFDYIEDLRMNAFAFLSGEQGFIGVYSGSVVTVYSFFSYLFSDPRFFVEIGDPSAEEEFTCFEPNRWVRLPKDPVRQSFALLLSTLAVDFLFMHEIGHLMNGHVELIRTQKNVLVFWEFPEGRTDAENLTRQTLEMDADSFAAAQGLGTVFARLSDPEQFPAEGWRQWYKEPKVALFSWILAVYGLFRLFFGGSTSFDGIIRQSHPPPNIRLLMTLQVVEEFLKKRSHAQLLNESNSMLSKIANTVEHFHALVTSTPFDPSGIQEAFDPRAKKHIGLLLDHWKILRPDLLSLARGGNLAE